MLLGGVAWSGGEAALALVLGGVTDFDLLALDLTAGLVAAVALRRRAGCFGDTPALAAADFLGVVFLDGFPAMIFTLVYQN